MDTPSTGNITHGEKWFVVLSITSSTLLFDEALDDGGHKQPANL